MKKIIAVCQQKFLYLRVQNIECSSTRSSPLSVNLLELPFGLIKMILSSSWRYLRAISAPFHVTIATPSGSQ